MPWPARRAQSHGCDARVQRRRAVADSARMDGTARPTSGRGGSPHDAGGRRRLRDLLLVVATAALLQASVLQVSVLRGTSMEPTLRDGDEILVDRTPRPLRAGIHVIRLEDVLLVKRLEPGPGGTVRIISDNPAYPRLERPLHEVELVGRVVWKGGRL